MEGKTVMRAKTENLEFDKFDYISVSVKNNMGDFCVKSYETFGWELVSEKQEAEGISLRLQREKKIRNKEQLTREQREMEKGLLALDHLHWQISFWPTVYAILVGMAGVGFLTGAGFGFRGGWIVGAVVGVILAVTCMTGSMYLYYYLVKRRTKASKPREEAIREEIYVSCERGRNILNQEIERRR